MGKSKTGVTETGVVVGVQKGMLSKGNEIIELEGREAREEWEKKVRKKDGLLRSEGPSRQRPGAWMHSLALRPQVFQSQTSLAESQYSGAFSVSQTHLSKATAVME